MQISQYFSIYASDSVFFPVISKSPELTDTVYYKANSYILYV